MGRRPKQDINTIELPPIRRAIDPESRENQMIAMATNLAEKQLREGTASSQVICHYLKLGTIEKKLELQKLENENKLLAAKTEAIESQKRIEELYANAIAAMKVYSGQVDDNDEGEDQR